jgi:hypothetical protein
LTVGAAISRGDAGYLWVSAIVLPSEHFGNTTIINIQRATLHLSGDIASASRTIAALYRLLCLDRFLD